MNKFMTDEEKGYHCPDDSDDAVVTCDNCELKNTKCIIFSTSGKKKLQEWKKNNSIK